MSKEYTTEEVRQKVIEHVFHMVEYWDKVKGEYDQRYRMEGLVHSIFVMLDGGSATLPGFVVAPVPHPTDKDYHIEQDEDYFPENHEAVENIKADIGGSLHELMNVYDPYKEK
jgi:hypothetical protein